MTEQNRQQIQRFRYVSVPERLHRQFKARFPNREDAKIVSWPHTSDCNNTYGYYVKEEDAVEWNQSVDNS